MGGNPGIGARVIYREKGGDWTCGKRGIASKYEQLVIDGVVGEAMKNWVLWGDKQGAMALGRTWKQGRDKDIAVQCSFLEMCERIGDAESDQLLVAGLAHQELRVRLSASRLLAKNFNAARQKLVCDALMGGKITLESIELLGKCGNSEAVPALDRIIASDDAANRSAAIGSVVRILGKDSLSRLAGWLSDQREGVSDAATNAVVALPGITGAGLVNLQTSRMFRFAPRSCRFWNVVLNPDIGFGSSIC